MKNVEIKVEKNVMTIKVDLKKDFGPSKSGKTTTVATTNGNHKVPDTDDIVVGLNVYKPRTEK